METFYLSTDALGLKRKLDSLGMKTETENFKTKGEIHYYVIKNKSIQKKYTKRINEEAAQNQRCSLRSKYLLQSVCRNTTDKEKSAAENTDFLNFKIALKRKIKIVTVNEVLAMLKETKRRFIDQNNSMNTSYDSDYISLVDTKGEYSAILKIFKRDKYGNKTTPKIHLESNGCLFINPKRKKQEKTKNSEIGKGEHAKVNKNKKIGFCENCKVRFSDVQKHINETSHLEIVRDEKNYSSLDALLKTIQNERENTNNKTKVEIVNVENEKLPNDNHLTAL